jgi:hypothetical protein
VATDFKYGKVTVEKGNIGDDEPVFVFRAQDELLPEVLRYYHVLCKAAGSPEHHLKGIVEARDAIVQWQERHGKKTPSSDSLKS